MDRRATIEPGMRPDGRGAGGAALPDDVLPAAAGPARAARAQGPARAAEAGSASGQATFAEAVPDSAAQGRARQWRGAGGRWLIWAFRAVVWAVLLIVGYRGVAAIVTGTGQPRAGAAPAPAASASRFPASQAEAYALEFGDVYLNVSPASAARRASELAAFLPSGSAPQFGWNGAGSLRLESEQVASIAVHSAHYATVTLLALVNDRLMELGVPVYAAHGGLQITAEPAWLAAPGSASPPSQPLAGGAIDLAAQAALESQLPAFFRAYASGDTVTLGRFLAPGAVVTGLGGAVAFGSISGIEVPPGGATRQIVVSVVWTVSGSAGSAKPPAITTPAAGAPATLAMSYQMTVVRQSGSWYVKAIGPSPRQPEAP
jgi:Conjugative transposon protein TcpC